MEKGEMTPSWERSKHSDDGNGLSVIALTLLKIGELLGPHKSGEPEKDEPAANKYWNFFSFFPHAERYGGDIVVEIGGGKGELSAHLAQWAKFVYCIEPHPVWVENARQHCAGRVNMKVLHTFGQNTPIPDATADLIILHDVMEHVAEPLLVLREANRLLKPNGEALVTFVPWFSPYGGHTWDFLPVPWLHALYSRKILAEMRSAVSGWHTTKLGATGLYRITISQFEEMIRESGLKLSSLQLLGVRGQQWMTRIPVLREFGTSIVAARLTK